MTFMYQGSEWKIFLQVYYLENSGFIGFPNFHRLHVLTGEKSLRCIFHYQGYNEIRLLDSFYFKVWLSLISEIIL